MRRVPVLLRRLAKLCLVVALVALGLLIVFQGRLIYFPRPYAEGAVSEWQGESGHTVIRYQTEEGPQQAYLLARKANPMKLWIVCGGNGSLALDWSDWLQKHGGADDAWLLFDMPGYGACGGSPRPESIRRSLRAAVPAAMQSLHWSAADGRGRLRIFGHSLGAAVCLMAACEFDIRRGVLLALFTSTMDMSSRTIGIPAGFLVWQRFDNRSRLREIEARGNARMFVFHGRDDEVIPVSMSRQLAADAPDTVRVTEVAGAFHNTLQDVAPVEIENAIRAARDDG